MIQASRNSILRHAEGGSSAGLSSRRKTLARLKKTRDAKGVHKFWAIIHREIGGFSKPHVHPRHLRSRP